jgi:hypothetical protein
MPYREYRKLAPTLTVLSLLHVDHRQLELAENLQMAESKLLINVAGSGLRACCSKSSGRIDSVLTEKAD